MKSPAHKVIITGTGRAGTTFLVQLLTELGLDTGYTPETWRKDYHEHCAAGLEKDILDPAAPYIVKSPELRDTLPAVLADGRIVIDYALIPIRRLEDAALSRIRVGGDGAVPGGLSGTADPARQKAVLAEGFHHLVETLAARDIPHAFLAFPRFVQDAGYTYGKLQPLLGKVAKNHGLTYVYFPAILRFHTLQQVEEGTFASTILSNDTYTLAFFESIVKSL